MSIRSVSELSTIIELALDIQDVILKYVLPSVLVLAYVTIQ